MKRLTIAFLFALSWMFWPDVSLAEEYSERLANLEANVTRGTAACMQAHPSQRAPLEVNEYTDGWAIEERGEAAILISAFAPVPRDAYAVFGHRELAMTFFHPMPWDTAIDCFLNAYGNDRDS
jgi:hypothetical protein